MGRPWQRKPTGCPKNDLKVVILATSSWPLCFEKAIVPCAPRDGGARAFARSSDHLLFSHAPCPGLGPPFGVEHMSLGDIHNLPPRSKFALFQGFLNFLSKAPKFRSKGGGV